jgi:hypothetical protein
MSPDMNLMLPGWWPKPSAAVPTRQLSEGITTRDNNKIVRLVMSQAYRDLWGDVSRWRSLALSAD